MMSVTARVLGPEGRGLMVTVVTWVALFAVIGGLSLGEVSQVRIQRRERQEWIPSLFGALLVFAGGLSFLSLLIAMLLYFATGGELIINVPTGYLVIGFLALPLIIVDQYGRFLLIGANRIRIYNIAQIVGSSVGLGATFAFLLIFEFGVPGALLATVAGQMVLVAIVLVALWQAAGRQVRVERTEVRGLLDGAFKLHLNTIGGVLIMQVNIPMLNHLATPNEVGLYQLGLQLIMPMMIIPSAASMLLYSKVASANPDEIWPEQKKLMLQILGAVLIMSAVVYGLAPLIVHYLAGPDFEPSVRVLRWLLPVVFGMTIAQIMSPQWITRGIFLPTSILTVITGLANLALNFVLIPAYGIMGAVYSMIFSYFGIVVVVQSLFAVWIEVNHRKLTSPPT